MQDVTISTRSDASQYRALDAPHEAPSPRQALDLAAWVARDASDMLHTVKMIGAQARLLGRVPLGTVVGSDEQRYVTLLQAAAETLSDRVTALLAVLNAASGALPLTRRPLDLVAVAKSVVDSTPPLRSCCRVSVAGSAGRPLADARLISQAVFQLLTHASKHSEAATIIDVFGPGNETRRARLTIEITYPTPAGLVHAEHFRAYAAAHIDDVRAHVSRALELYVCKLIVEAHDGHLWPELTATGAVRWHLCLPTAATTATASRNIEART